MGKGIGRQISKQKTAIGLIVAMLFPIPPSDAGLWSRFTRSTDHAYKGFKSWTNELGEDIWHFESRCRDIVPAKPPCPPGLGIPGDAALARIGAPIEEIQDFLWFKEALQSRQQDLKDYLARLDRMLATIARNPVDPGQDPELWAEIERSQTNLMALAMLKKDRDEVDREIRSRVVQGEVNATELARLRAQQGDGAVANAVASSKLQALETRKTLIQKGITALLQESPWLAHPRFNTSIEEIQLKGAEFEANSAEFPAVMKDAFMDIRKTIGRMLEERAKTYAQVLKTEKDPKRDLLHSRELRDPDLLQELVLSVDASRLPHADALEGAACRYEQRVAMADRMDTIRAVSFFVALTAAVPVAGAFGRAAAASARAATLSRGAQVFKSVSIATLRAESLGIDIALLQETEKKCDAIQSEVMGGERSATNKDTRELVQDCKHQFGSLLVLTLLGNRSVVPKGLIQRLKRAAGR